MPSTLLTRASGFPFILASGNIWSGQGAFNPVGGIQLYLHRDASGYAYVGFSGSFTVNSGFLGALSGGGTTLTDAFAIPPNGSLFVPKTVFISGSVSIWATCDAAASGQARLYWQAF